MDEIVGEDGVASESASIATEPWDLGLNLPISIGHESPLMLAATDSKVDRGIANLSWGCNPMMSVRLILCKNL